MTREGADVSLAADESRRTKIYLALAAVAVARLWVMPLAASFWLDETLTFWTVCKGIAASIPRSQFNPGQSLPYTLIAAITFRLAGPSEIALRLPSLFAALVAAWLLFRLGLRLFDREAGILAVVVFVSLQELSRTAANARPYTLGLVMVVGSVLQLVRWLDTGRQRNMWGYVLLSAGILYFHYLFATAYVVHVAYAFYRVRSGGPVRWSKLITAGVLVLILVSPLVWYTVHLNRAATASVFATTPSLSELVTALMPPALGAGIFAGLLLGRALFRSTSVGSLTDIPSETFLLLLCWLLVPILTLFAVSRLTPFKLFVDRYYLPAFPALALLVGWGIRSLVPEKVRVCVSSCIVIAAIASFGSRHLMLSPYRDDWRAAAAAVRAANLGEQTPVLVRPGLIESSKVNWDLNIDRDSPLLCPLSKYPIPGRIILVPARLDTDSIRYLNDVSSQILEPAVQFVFVTRDDNDMFKPWLLGRFSDRGFEVSNLGRSDGVSAMLFRRK